GVEPSSVWGGGGAGLHGRQYSSSHRHAFRGGDGGGHLGGDVQLVLDALGVLGAGGGGGVRGAEKRAGDLEKAERRVGRAPGAGPAGGSRPCRRCPAAEAPPGGGGPRWRSCSRRSGWPPAPGSRR